LSPSHRLQTSTNLETNRTTSNFHSYRFPHREVPVHVSVDATKHGAFSSLIAAIPALVLFLAFWAVIAALVLFVEAGLLAACTSIPAFCSPALYAAAVILAAAAFRAHIVASRAYRRLPSRATTNLTRTPSLRVALLPTGLWAIITLMGIHMALASATAATVVAAAATAVLWKAADEKAAAAKAPPPPPGLKLEGGSLPGEAAKYIGTYHLDRSKLVNGRPAYQHTGDATRWIAFDGNGWMGQNESVLGENKGYLHLQDSAAASPDVSAKTWKASAGGAAAWVEAPQLKCTAWTPPPPGLKLEGGSLTGEPAKYIGTYLLDRSKLVNGRPAYQHTSDATLWIAFAGAGWKGQPQSLLGETKGFLDLEDSAAASPNVSAKIWKAWTGSAWVEAPQLKCTAWTPPPPGLKLEGGSLTGEPAKYIGTYHLDRSKLVNDRPAYQHTSDATLWIAFAGAGWKGQPQSLLGEIKGFLDLEDSAAASPNVSAKIWKAWTGSAWVEAPQLKCTAWTPPPPGLKLEGGSLTGEPAKYIGTYLLDRSKLVNGRPAYQHTSDATRWIAFAGDGWTGQLESQLGEKKGYLDLRDSAAASPDVSAKTWMAWNGSGWVEAPQLKCTAWTPPPPGLKLEGGSLTGEPAKYIGTYLLDRSKLVNGRPAYQHTGDATLWIAFAGAGWKGQPESLLGEDKGFLDLVDSAAASPDVSAKTWQAWNGSAWVEQPQLKCTALVAVQIDAPLQDGIKEVARQQFANDKHQQKAAAAKALQEVEDAQLAAVIAASLNVSEHPVARVKRWGDGLEAPAAGSRHFVPQGFKLKLEVPEAIECFGHSKSHVREIMDAGRAKASTSPTPLASSHAAALFAYTEETTLYGTLNYTMRTPHTSSTPTDTELKHYADYIVHMEAALSSLPTHVSEMQGKVYRGINVLLNPDIYAPGKQITWQGFSSSTKKQMATLNFLSMLPGRKLQGSLFVIDSITAKDIRHFSAIPSEEEVLFPPNSQFKVTKVVTSEPEKKALLNQLSAYDMTDLDVYVLRQMA
jgi:hypothetical protein